jgi:hypothetical protein
VSPKKRSHTVDYKCILFLNICLLKEIEEDRQLAQRSGATATTTTVESTKDTTATMRGVSKKMYVHDFS